MRQIMAGQSDCVNLQTYKVHCDKASGITIEYNPKQNQLSKKPKRFRSAFTTEQIVFLERQFKKFPYINKEHRVKISAILKIDERPIKIWFQNRRMKEKKENQKERDDETINYTPVFDKNQFSNALPLTDDQRSQSLLSSIADAAEKANTGCIRQLSIQPKDKTSSKPESRTLLNVEMKPAHSEAKYYKEAGSEDHKSPYFHSPRANVTKSITINSKNKEPQSPDTKRRASAEFSINLCKQYKQKSVAISDKHEIKANQEQKMEKLELEKPQEPLQNSPKRLKLLKQDPSHHISSEQLAENKKPKLVHTSLPQAPRPVDSSYYPVMPTIYTPPFVSSGGVLWKPVNVMPVITPNPTSVPLNLPGSTFHEQNQRCGCNCHGSSHHIPMTFSPTLQNPYAQYMITMPYQHTSPKY